MGGEYVLQRISLKELRRFFNRQIKLNDQVTSLTDHRKKREIPLSHIFYSLLYTTILSKNTFLNKDKFLRKHFTKRFIGSNRTMVASDSTLFRNLGTNIETDELQAINFVISQNHDNLKLIEPTLKKICGILDGTFIGGFMKEVLFIPGETDFIFNFNSIPKRGKELVSAKKLLNETNERVGSNYFDLILGDGLYYSKNMFQLCRETLGSHLLVKTSERLNVVKDVEAIIHDFPKQIDTKTGFDSDRLLKYKINVVKDVTADTIDYPLQVAIIEEISKDKKENFYVITSDLSLTPEELRYAAHLRWRIENNGFKELNHLYNTKRKYTKNETCFTNLFWIIVLAYNLFHLYLNFIDISDFIISGKSVLKDWIDLLYESIIEDFSYNSS